MENYQSRNQRAVTTLVYLAFLSALIFSLSGCGTSVRAQEARLVQVNTLDANGFSEVVSSQEKLDALESRDYIAQPQPYKKVARLYKKGPRSELTGKLTSYHKNGQIYQYLETEGSHARGAYKQWYPNGQLKIEANIASGRGDLDPASECTWVFDGVSRAWTREGRLEAEMCYAKGVLSGLATYFYPSGAMKRLERYEEGVLWGKVLDFYPGGSLYKEASYERGALEGQTQFFAPTGERIALETWSHGKLREGRYLSAEGLHLSCVDGGSGIATYASLAGGSERHTFQGGRVCGVAKLSEEGALIHSWELDIEGKKHGKESLFHADGIPHLEITWHHGLIHGEQKSWYRSGSIESVRLMENNKRSGPSTAWYENGDLMLAETYDEDRLVEGAYFRPGENEPVSRVKAGVGTATLFDGAGLKIKRVTYDKGEPALQTKSAASN